MHQFTTALTEEYDAIGIEDLHVKGMMRNRKLSRSIADLGFHELKRQLEYKAESANINLIIADRWFASSKICSHCDEKIDSLPLSVREWTCAHRNTHHGRDINAATNLEKLAVSSTASACGAPSGGVIAFAIASHGALKQEFNTKVTYG